MTKTKTKLSYSFVKLLTGSDLSRRRLPFMTLKSENQGPLIWLTACIHGDEVGGMVIIQELFRKLKSKLLRGSIYAFPLMNPIGFENHTRHITFSREDLNRSFPGSANGTLGERIAFQIFNKIKESKPDLVLDLHNDWRQSVPYVLLDKPAKAQSKTTQDFVLEQSRKSGFYLVEDTDEIHNSLSYALLQHCIPSITFEMGESFVVNEKSIGYGVNSILNILKNMKMINEVREQETFPLLSLYQTDQVLKYNDKPLCTKSGIIRFLVKPGSLVFYNQPLAKIFNPFGKLQETLKAQHKAIVLGTADSAVAYPGMSPMVFGLL